MRQGARTNYASPPLPRRRRLDIIPAPTAPARIFLCRRRGIPRRASASYPHDHITKGNCCDVSFDTCFERFACVCAGTVNATEYQVRMMNQGTTGMMQFEPQLLKISPGDTVHFVAIDKGHNAQSIEGMIPPGAKAFTGEISQDLSVTLTVPGVYGYRCNPHGSLGMVGLIVVGKPTNEAAAKSAALPGIAGRVFAKLFDGLDATRTASN